METEEAFVIQIMDLMGRNLHRVAVSKIEEKLRTVGTHGLRKSYLQELHVQALVASEAPKADVMKIFEEMFEGEIRNGLFHFTITYHCYGVSITDLNAALSAFRIGLLEAQDRTKNTDGRRRSLLITMLTEEIKRVEAEANKERNRQKNLKKKAKRNSKKGENPEAEEIEDEKEEETDKEKGAEKEDKVKTLDMVEGVKERSPDLSIPERSDVEDGSCSSLKKSAIEPEPEPVQICIPEKDLMQYSHGEFTNYKTPSFFRGKLTTNIFRGKLTIPVPAHTTVQEPIQVTYFKMDKKTYEMAGFLWLNFAMEHPNDYILSLYGVGATIDEEYFIVSQSFEEPLSTWIEDHINFSDDDRLLCDLKSFLKDVMNGGIQVHDKSNGSMNAEVSINNIYIVNMRAKLGLLSPTAVKKKLPTHFITTFSNMVRDEIFHEIPLPLEFESFLLFMTYHKSKWPVIWHTHPVFLSASQQCKFAKLAYEEVRGSLKENLFKSELKFQISAYSSTYSTTLGINDIKWIDNVQLETLRDVLKFKSKTGDEDEEMVVEEAMQVGVEVKKIDYVNTPWSFFKFYRNLVVHIKKIVVEMDKIFPSFLFCVHEALTKMKLYVAV